MPATPLRPMHCPAGALTQPTGCSEGCCAYRSPTGGAPSPAQAPPEATPATLTKALWVGEVVHCSLSVVAPIGADA